MEIYTYVRNDVSSISLLMNYELMKAGLPHAVIKAIDRAHTTDDDKKFVQLVSDSVDESLDLWLSVI